MQDPTRRMQTALTELLGAMRVSLGPGYVEVIPRGLKAETEELIALLDRELLTVEVTPARSATDEQATTDEQAASSAAEEAGAAHEHLRSASAQMIFVLRTCDQLPEPVITEIEFALIATLKAMRLCTSLTAK